jgi:predicted nucleotidyltransferase
MSVFDTSPEHKYTQQQKADRRRAVAESLEGRRAALSSDPRVLEITKDLRRVVEEMKCEYPDLVGVGLFGSLVKGYARPDSDVDAFLYVDTNRVITKDPEASGVALVTPNSRTKFLGEEFMRRIQERGRQIDHVFVGRLDEKFIKTLFGRPGDASAKYLARFFMVSLGKDILDYRASILDRLTALGVQGDRMFIAMMDELSSLENFGFSSDVEAQRRALYPKTIDAARSYFLALQPQNASEQAGQKKAA